MPLPLHNIVYYYYLKRFIHLAFSVGALVYFSYAAMSTAIEWNYIAGAVFGTFAYYNLHSRLLYVRIQNMAGSPFSDKAILLYLSLLIFSFIYLTIGFKDCIHFLWLLSAGFLSAAYLLPLFFRGSRLKMLPYLKIFIIASVFTIVSSIIPLVGKGFDFTELTGLAFSRFLFIVALCLIFDIGDMSDDMKAGIRTFPVELGIKRTKIIAWLCIIIAFWIEAFYTYSFLIDVTAMIALSITYMITIVLIARATPERSVGYFLFLTDGMMLLPAILYSAFGLL